MTAAQLNEISKWKLEAHEEDNARYFFRPTEYERLLDGDICYVVGRKGSGKSAIAANIARTEEFDTFTATLSFKDFPFNILYEQGDADFTSPSQYTTVWKFVILSSICGLMAQNEAIRGELVPSLQKTFSTDFNAALRGSTTKAGPQSFSISIAEVIRVELGKAKSEDDRKSLGERVRLLEKLIIEYLDDSKYFVIFDELDEDYDDVLISSAKKSYFDLLTGLFKAVAAIRRSFSVKPGIRPVVFLRDDIYDLIKNNDKNKWDDLRWDLRWTPDQLKTLIGFRIARAFDPSSRQFDWKKSLNTFFANSKMSYGHRKKRERPVINHVLDRTMWRPRDLISFFRECAALAVERKMQVAGQRVVKDCEEQYSIRLRQEIVDEMHSLIPDIEGVLDEIGKLRLHMFRYSDLEPKLRNSDLDMANLSPEKVAELLFHFNVVGNVPKQEKERIYRYKNPRSKFSIEDKLIVHPGLMRSLEVT